MNQRSAISGQRSAIRHWSLVILWSLVIGHWSLAFGATVLSPGTTDYSQYVVLTDSSTGAPKTGVVATAIACTYTRNRSTVVTDAAAVALAAVDSAHADFSAIEVDATNAPGLYRVDWPDAAFAAGVDKVLLSIVATGCIAIHEQVDLQILQTGDSFSRLGSPAGGSVIADLGTATANTQALILSIRSAFELDGDVYRLTANAFDNLPDVTLEADQTHATIGETQTAGTVDEVIQCGEVGTVTGNVNGRILGGGSGSISGIGAWAAGAAGSALALGDTALSNLTWTAEKAAFLDAAISTAGGGADPLLSAVPGAYAQGTAGYALGHYLSYLYARVLAAANITVSAPTTSTGTLPPIYQGASYDAANLSISRTWTSPDLSSPTSVTFYLVPATNPDAEPTTVTCTMVITGDSHAVTIPLTGAQTAALTTGAYRYQIWVVKAAKSYPLFEGDASVKRRFGS